MAIITPHNKQLKNKGRKKEVSKKYGLVAVFALVLVLGFASTVLAAQNVDYSGSPTDGVNDFAPTPVDDLYFPNEADPGAYKIHSNYTATTDACASCHSTHTAVGEALLQLGSATDVCMACHDGSVTTTYDVKNGLIGNTTMPTSGGMFGDMNTTLSSESTHNVKGALSVYAAPGGPGTPGVEAGVVWKKEFGCESCHSPHGTGGNARILNPDVNGVAVAAYAKGAYNLVNGVNVGGSKGVPLVKDSDGTYYSNWKNVDPAAKDQWLWSGHSYRNNTKVYVDGVQKSVNTDYTLNNTAGFTKVAFTTPPAAGSVVTADIYPGVVVQMNVSNYLQTNEKVQHVAGLNDFCGACHTDYNTSTVDGPDSNLNGTYTEAYRHKVNFKRSDSVKATLTKFNMPLETRGGVNYVSCETCHVAHGTNSDYWIASLKVANGGALPTGLEAVNLKELAGSSALKRIPNMGTCEACHAKGVAAQGPGSTGNVAAPSVISSNTPGGGYVWREACESCHSNVSEHFSETWHSSMSRPGVTKVTWESVKGSLVNADGSFNEAYAPTLDAKSIEGFAKALYTTMIELEGKAMFDAKGAIITDPAVWKVKAIDPAKIQVWTTGTTAQEILIKGSSLGKIDLEADKWYIVTFWGRPTSPTDFESAGEEEDYTCGSTAFGCHTTGKDTNNGSADFTVWLNAAVTGTQPFELGVGCETCHGQGGNHVKAPSATNIVNPANFTPVEQTVGKGATKNVDGTWSVGAANKYLDINARAMACGLCHRGANHQGDYYSSGFYKSGDPATAFTPSEHFTSGLVSCNNCHDTHQESKGLISYGTSQQVCESCHGTQTNFNLGTYMAPLLKNAAMHQHQFNTGEISTGKLPQSYVGRRTP